MEGWVDLDYPAMHWPGVKLTISQTQVRRPDHYTTEPLHNYITAAKQQTEQSITDSSKVYNQQNYHDKEITLSP